jgi:hypothetical protein
MILNFCYREYTTQATNKKRQTVRRESGVGVSDSSGFLQRTPLPMVILISLHFTMWIKKKFKFNTPIIVNLVCWI